ncbi:DNA cytosine methyltransferase [Ciceribacter sp. L1K22]|uniref:DNA cytosine methyltransferase n=1 Tax=Ciceribacter sp. L1K22 TaxID=2820275 RepID=UPI001ABECD8A|nr:DNA cytosine methyltransferase [Ciceribacter sp. L1K22]MBO3760374.1 DNA cytosine methyltransferase [Ciceribacter sp. L1K22]
MDASSMLTTVEFTHWHLFCGLGGGAKGFNKGTARVGNLRARFRCVGGVDVDPAGLRDFERLTGAPGTLLDMFDLEQYRAFHGLDPAPGWRAAEAEDIRRSAGGEFPDIVFLSAPCKGFSGLLPEQSSLTAKYQALNRLTLRGIWLMLEAFKEKPPKLIIFENVPRIMTRGRKLLDQIVALLRSYGYAVAETKHDCGELGGLGQSRKRFLLVARHEEQVPPFLYEPDKRRLLGVGEVLEKLPLPGDPRGGPMHRVPSLQWKTWVRLAFVEAGSDWRSLNKLAVEDGYLRDYAIEPLCNWQPGVLGVRGWGESCGVVAGRSSPTNGAFSVADPRPPIGSPEYQQYGVRRWGEPSGAVINVKSPGQGTFAVADPRPTERDDYKQTKYRVTKYGEAAGTVIAASTTGNGAFAVADPRPVGLNANREHYKTGGHYGVVPWDDTTGAVPAYGKYDRGPWSVADPRNQPTCAEMQTEQNACLPKPTDRLVAVIRALDGTCHRPFTTLELAALQSLFDPEEMFPRLKADGEHSPRHWESFTLDGQSESAWRERIGNAVPPDAAEAIANVMGTTLLLAMTGQTFMLSNQPIWVQPIALALAVDQRGNVPVEAVA